jgi:hypothetical protein
MQDELFSRRRVMPQLCLLPADCRFVLQDNRKPWAEAHGFFILLLLINNLVQIINNGEEHV